MKQENLIFLIEERDIILIKYCILFLTMVFNKKFSFNFFNNI